MAGKKKKNDPKQTPNQRTISQNRKARHRFNVLETLECGIQLVGSEVKSLRDGKISLEEAYGRVSDGELWLVGCDIPEYTQANQWNHEPRRPRKLLVHQREIHKFANQAHEKGLTLVPLMPASISFWRCATVRLRSRRASPRVSSFGAAAGV